MQIPLSLDHPLPFSITATSNNSLSLTLNTPSPSPSSSSSMTSSSWIKSLQCKSNSFDDVISPSKKPLIPISCGGGTTNDVIFFFPKHHSPPPKKSKPKPVIPTSPAPPCPTSFPTLTELPPGHSSRRVVEIIFGSSWSDRGLRFPGRIEMLFRIHNPHRTVARFEEYRSAVKSRAGDARCAVDGNEMMRFHRAPSLSACCGEVIYDCEVLSPPGGEGIRTFAGSGGAHQSGGGGPGRRAMLVCRVIAGRVRNGSDPESSGESVCGMGKGELVVFDPRAVLPCFLIIYKI